MLFVAFNRRFDPIKIFDKGHKKQPVSLAEHTKTNSFQKKTKKI